MVAVPNSSAGIWARGPFRFGGDSSSRGQADAFRDAENMGVDGHGGLVVDDRDDYVGGFAAHALQSLERFDGIGTTPPYSCSSLWPWPPDGAIWRGGRRRS